MIREVQFLQNLHQSTPRDYLARMNAEKPHCCEVAKKFGHDYWDGDRKYGYGGMWYDGRWKPVAETMQRHYGLPSKAWALDIGCGKGFLAHDLHNYCGIKTDGIDISYYAVMDGKNGHSRIANCTDLPCPDEGYDFVYSINVFHNLGARDLKQSVQEMMRVAKPGAPKYICVESYRNEQEKFNLQCWALTCQQFHSPEDWKWLLESYGYDGDVEFIYFQ